MTSTRLPGKVLQLVAGHPLLYYHVKRVQQSGLPIYLAVTTNAADDPLAAFATDTDLLLTRGNEHDVLSRYQQCAAQYELDIIVRVTSDCPLLDGALIAQGVHDYVQRNDPRLYLSNVLERTFPRGLDFEVFSRELLDEAARKATLASDREHVTPYIHQNRSGAVRFEHMVLPQNHSDYRLTVDTAEDFLLIQQLIEQYQADTLPFDALISLLDQHPELVALNAHIEQKKI